MKALISPIETNLHGARIAQVSTESFDIAEPLYWVDCPIDVTPETHTYDEVTKQFVLIPVAPVNPVPQTVTRFQARAALSQAGYFTPINTYMNSLPEDNFSRLAWEDAQEFQRTSALVNSMAVQFGLTEPMLDALFIAAAKIKS